MQDLAGSSEADLLTFSSGLLLPSADVFHSIESIVRYLAFGTVIGCCAVRCIGRGIPVKIMLRAESNASDRLSGLLIAKRVEDYIAAMTMGDQIELCVRKAIVKSLNV